MHDISKSGLNGTKEKEKKEKPKLMGDSLSKGERYAGFPLQ